MSPSFIRSGLVDLSATLFASIQPTLLPTVFLSHSEILFEVCTSSNSR